MLGGASQARPTLHGTLMQRMTDVLSRMLNDPATRAALSHGGEGAFPETDHQPSHSDPAPHGTLLIVYFNLVQLTARESFLDIK